jgi:hypothetical protein
LRESLNCFSAMRQGGNASIADQFSIDKIDNGDCDQAALLCPPAKLEAEVTASLMIAEMQSHDREQR